jgi:hypothetical protein
VLTAPLDPPTAEYVPQPLPRCVRTMARSQRTSFSSTKDHPAPFVKRPALAPMYTALGLMSLDLVISNPKLRWAGHVRRVDWSRRPRTFLTSGVEAYRCRGRAHSYGHDLARELQLIGLNRQGGRAVRRLAELGGRSSRQRGTARARSSATAGACGNEIHLRTSAGGMDSV